MARTITHTGGGPFIGNPITFAIPAINLNGRPSIDLNNVSFHRVIMTVSVNGVTYELSHSVPYEPSDGSTVMIEFDISSALRSAAESQVYEPLTSGEAEYNVYNAIINAHDVWIYDGDLVDNQGVAEPTSFAGIAGAFSDYERLHTSQTATSSRKPATGEIVYVGDIYVYGQLFDGSRMLPHSVVANISEAMSDTTQQFEGRSVFVQSSSEYERRNSALFQFVNSRGVMESVRTYQLAKEELASESENIVIARPETFRGFSRRTLRKTASTLSLSYSSGFCDYAWARWWMDEFCMSDHHWMLAPDGIWIPCTVKVDDKATLIDGTKREMNYVQFTVTPDIHGAMW